MADVKLMVMYPRPQDMEAFDHLYQDEDVAAGDGLQWRSAAFPYRGRDYVPFWHHISMGPAERARVSADTPASAVLARRSAIETHCFP